MGFFHIMVVVPSNISNINAYLEKVMWQYNIHHRYHSVIIKNKETLHSEYDNYCDKYLKLYSNGLTFYDYCYTVCDYILDKDDNAIKQSNPNGILNYYNIVDKVDEYDYVIVDDKLLPKNNLQYDNVIYLRCHI
jgi:hypothetical protein